MFFQQVFASKKKLIYCLAIITFLLFSRSLFNNFVWDDEEQIVNNVAVHTVSNIPRHFFGSTFHTGGAGKSSGAYYKPLMSTSFTILHVLGGGQPVVYHFFQLLLHIANVIFLFLLFNKVLHKQQLAFFLSLIFAIHPFNVESVVYISALQDVQFLFFGLLSLIVFIYRHKLKKTDVFLLSSILILAAMLSKETGLLFLLIYPLFLIIFYPKLFKKHWQNLFFYLFGILVFYLFLRLAVAQVKLGTQGLAPIARASYRTRLLTVPKIIFFYLATFFWPRHLLIAQHWLVENPSWEEFYGPLLLVGVFTIVLAFLLFRFYKKGQKQFYKIALFFVACFCLSIGLHLHLIPLDMTVADRWFYLPMTFLLGLIGLGFLSLNFKKLTTQIKKVFLISLSLFYFLLILRSVERISNWRDGLTLFLHDIQYVEASFDLENNVGTELARADRTEEAMQYFARSIELQADWWINWNNLGVMYQRLGAIEQAKFHYQQATANGHYHLAYVNLASLLLVHYELAEAYRFSLDAVKIFPYNYQLRTILAINEYKLGNQLEALKQANYAYQLAPSLESASLLELIKNNEKLPEFKQ